MTPCKQKPHIWEKQSARKKQKYISMPVKSILCWYQGANKLTSIGPECSASLWTTQWWHLQRPCPSSVNRWRTFPGCRCQELRTSQTLATAAKMDCKKRLQVIYFGSKSLNPEPSNRRPSWTNFHEKVKFVSGPLEKLFCKTTATLWFRWTRFLSV